MIIEAWADTLAHALAMLPDERHRRMRALRDTIAGNNIYRWAGKVLQTLTALLHRRPIGTPKESVATMLPLLAITKPSLVALIVAD